jgi:phosphoserine aminotransferase
MKFFTVGPAELYPTCQQHYQTAFEQQIGSISHRSEAFRKIYQHTDEQLRALLNIPATHQIYFTSSATEIWERLLLNLVDQYSFHFVQGAFSQKFYDYANSLQKKPTLHKVQDGLGFENLNEINIEENTELICFTQNETASGIRVPEDEMSASKPRFTNALICCDVVSAVPYVAVDFTTMDSAFFSVQKGMGMPPGLGVWIVNEACLNKAEQLKQNGKNIGAHFQLSAFAKNYKKFETPSTPNTMAIYVLGKIAEDMNNYGIQKIRQETETKFETLYDFIQQEERFHFLSSNKNHLSRTTMVANSTIAASELNKKLKPHEMIIASGYGSFKDQQIRIANFPSIKMDELENLLSVI